ncbi:DUF2206 domain-containing protein [Actinospica robiniae]|uniref:DUF2206 domain-containing protein n=1 Tax=Actinospica robiniae TaxID=304901 RepID=UPI0004229296|nr:DUF2206 domain-containing protein [Actinospica robiniae]
MRLPRSAGPLELRARQWVLIATTLAFLAEAFGPAELWLRDSEGLWLIFGAPVAIWYGCATRVVTTRESAGLIALGFGLMTDLAAMFGLNEISPLLGDEHPLTKVPILVTAAATVLVLGAALPEARSEDFEPWSLGAGGVKIVTALGLLALVLAVAGPVRLNNGFSDHVSIAAFLCVTVLLVLVFVREQFSLEATEIGVYCGSLALLLLTSLRGWLVTGHDIQKEYGYFSLALSGAHWDVRSFSDAYNACLSITLLPVEMVRLTAIPGEYFFKALLPVLFATCPLMIFRAARHVAGHRVAVLSALFFVMFPTYFTDMPYEGRQEVAFVMLGGAMLLVTDSGPSVRRRRIAFLALMSGLVVAHYSTTYVVVLVLGAAVAADLVWRLGTRLRRRRTPSSAGSRSRGPRRREEGKSFITWWMVIPVAAFAVFWAGPVTGTAGQLLSTVSVAFQEMTGAISGSASSGTAYSIFGAANESDAQRLGQYRDASITESAPWRAQGGLPLSLVDQYDMSYVKPSVLPLTGIGKRLQSAGVDVQSTNGLVRDFAAYLLQAMIFIGLLAAWLRYRPASGLTRDQVTLTFGGLLMLALVTVIPQLSVDYSILRAFQQGFFFFAPVMAVGMMWLLSWLKRGAVPVCCAVIAALMLDLTGVVPRATGGYPAQLSLSNSGEYYDIYDPTVAEEQGATWLEDHIAKGTDPSGVSIQTDEFTYNRLLTLLAGNGIISDNLYPTLLEKQAYTFVGAQTVEKHQATIFYQGDLVTYRYPITLLHSVYNEIYSSDGVEIFQ